MRIRQDLFFMNKKKAPTVDSQQVLLMQFRVFH